MFRFSALLHQAATIASSLVLLSFTLPAEASAQSFDCAAHGGKGRIQLMARTLYSASTSSTAGFDLGMAPTEFGKRSCSSEAPFFFSAAEKDGNYRVTLRLGSDTADSTTTVKAESRRVMVDRMYVARGGERSVEFVVHVRSATIYPAAGETGAAPPKQVKLKPREIGALDWDEKLTLEFNGDHPSLRSISIQPVSDVPTVYLAGDSTVVDQDKEPWAAWGQMLPAFFGPGVSIANEAESGETIRSFIGELRYAKIFSTIKPGDFLMIQFAHNDQKPGSGYVPAATDYKAYLRQYIAEARRHGATPILVTSMNRRKFSDGKIEETLGAYPQAMRDVAAEEKVALIDLNALSKTLFEAMGEAGTLKAFVHYPANSFPNQPEDLKDDTHFNAYGAYELARALVQSMRDQRLPPARFLRADVPAFDPARPDAVAQYTLPPSPNASAATPYGR